MNSLYFNSNQTEKFSVSNYPNPFNPVTKILFNLPKDSKVKIIVYNSIGQVVKELINQWLGAGIHSVEFNGSNSPSGVYFYRIEAGDYISAKKMLLIK